MGRIRKPRPAQARPVAHEKVTAVSEAIAGFERDNRPLVEALELFGMSAGEYERAMLALNGATITSASSSATESEGDLAFLE